MSRTRLFPQTALVAALTFAGSTALASGQPPVSFELHGIRMLAGPATGRFVQPPIAEPGLVKIFDNLLPARKYPYGTYFCCYAPAVAGPDNGYGVPPEWWGEAFTPTANATVTKIEVTVTYLQGTNSIDVGLYNDANGIPGTPLVSKDIQNVPPFGSCCATLTLKDKDGIAVTAGTQYWVVVSTDSNDTDFFGAWNYNTSDQVTKTTQAQNLGSGWQAGPIAPGLGLAVWGK